MDKIPFISAPYPDELFYSYLIRIRDLNFFDDKYFFEKVLDLYEGAASKRNLAVYDFNRNLESFFFYSRISNPLSFYFKTSCYLFISAFLKPEEKAKIIGYCLSDYSDYPYIWPVFKQSFKDLKICPECVKEDESKYGKFYHHRSHQAQGVDMCYKHKCHLMSYTGKPTFEFDLNLYKNIENNDEYLSLLYAELAHILLNPDSELRLNFLDNFENEDDFSKFIEKVIPLATKNVYKPSVEDKEIIKERILFYLENGFYNSDDSFAEKLDDCEILKYYQDDICLCRCKKCGKEFISSKPALHIGYTCPCTRKDRVAEDIILNLYNKNRIDRYELLIIPNFDSKSSLVLYDKACNNILLIYIKDFLFRRFDRIKNKPASIPSGPYKDISYEDLDALDYAIFVNDLGSLTVECKHCLYSYRPKDNSYITPCRMCKWTNSDMYYRKMHIDDIIK